MSLLGTAFFSNTTVLFALLGIATGSLNGAVALGIVLTHRASGVLNFGAGAIGATSAFLFYSLRDEHGVNWIVALVLALALGAVVGAITQVLVMSALRKVSVLGKLIATLGIMTLAMGTVVLIWGPVSRGLPDSTLPTNAVHIGSALAIPAERLIIIGIALTLAVVLRFAYTRTLFGLATSAVAESRRVAASSGWSPTVIELGNFMIAGVLFGGAAILLAPLIGLDVSVLTLTVLPALAAALVGRFSSFAITVAAALVIGILSAELQLFQVDIAGLFGWSPTALGGLPEVVPLLIIVVVTALSGRSRLQRGETLTRLPLPGDGRIPPVLLGVGTAVGMILVFSVSASWDDAFATTFCVAILVLSVVVVTGYAGQLSLCQYALAGFGAWVAARLAATQGIPFEAALLLGVAITIPLGLVVALPALRTRGVNLAVATLALASMIYALVFNNGLLTGGYSGTVVKPPHFLGINIDPINRPDRYAAFVLATFVIVGLGVSNLRRGRAGRRLLAVRANERAAASVGVGVYEAKLYAFGLSSAIAAVAGILLAFRRSNIRFTDFDVFGSINAVLYAVIGGVGWPSGSILGALQAPSAVASAAINALFSGVQDLTSWLLVFSGVGVFAILKQSPDGLAALQSRQWQAVSRPFRRRRPPADHVAPEPRRTRKAAELQVSSVSVRFGGVIALDDVTFAVQPGEIVGLIGPNGAGKTTLLDVVTGFTKAASGSVLLDGKPVDALSPERRARSGIGRSWQAVELFEEMSVRENLLVGADSQSPVRYLVDLVRPGRPAPTEVMIEVIEDFDLETHLDQRPSSLSQGTARLVGIGRAIVTEPSILLLDEPAAGLDSRESAELGVAILAAVARSGVGVLIVEHDVNLLLSICHRIVVLDFGKMIADGTPDEVAKDPNVIAAYLGTAAKSGAQDTEPAIGLLES